jgi:NAD(P)-dependent dehydrogenase (short-subunit alcohol dehydrogenase family)
MIVEGKFDRVRGRDVLVTTGRYGFKTYDVSDPTQPELSASLLGDALDARREELRATLPIGRVVGPADVASLAVHLMINTAITGTTVDIDGGQKVVE